MHQFKTLRFVIVCVACVAVGSTGRTEESGFEPLFDGKSLAGWEGNRSVFRVQDGAIVAGDLKDRIPHNEFLCTLREYGDFELRLSAKLLGQGKNAGIQFRSQRIPNHHEVSGYQCDMGEMRGKPIWGWLYDESRRRKFLVECDDPAVAKSIKAEDWNEIVIRCKGPLIEIWVNGLQTVKYQESDAKIPSRGIIGLQIHGGSPAEAWYKNIRIQELR